MVIAPREARDKTKTSNAESAVRGFIETANELDAILQEAEARRERGEIPKDLWLYVLPGLEMLSKQD